MTGKEKRELDRKGSHTRREGSKEASPSRRPEQAPLSHNASSSLSLNKERCCQHQTSPTHRLRKLGPRGHLIQPPASAQNNPAQMRASASLILQDSQEGFHISCNLPVKCFIVLTPGSHSQDLIYTLFPQPTTLALGLQGLPL